MKTRIGSISVLAIALLLGISTIVLPQTQAKSTESGTNKKTEIKAEHKMSGTKESSKKVKKAILTNAKHSKTNKQAAKETKTDKKIQ
jgi:hypothetical protein